MKILWMLFAIVFAITFLNSCDSDDGGDDCTPKTWYQDSDNDGLGNVDISVEDCDQPEGYVDNADDEDDTTPFVENFFSIENKELDIIVNDSFNFLDPSKSWQFELEKKVITEVTNTSGKDLQVRVFIKFISNGGHSISFCDQELCYAGITEDWGDDEGEGKVFTWGKDVKAIESGLFSSGYLYSILAYDASGATSHFDETFDPTRDLVNGKTEIVIYFLDPEKTGTVEERAYFSIPTSVDFQYPGVQG